jgi:hypothetical protein
VPGLDPISGDTLPLVIQPPYQFPAAGMDAMPDSSALGGQTCAKPSGDVIHLKLLDGDDPPGLPKGHDLKVRLFVDRNLLLPPVSQHLLCFACIAFIIFQTIVTGALLDGYRSLYLSYPFIYPFTFSFQLDIRWCSCWLQWSKRSLSIQVDATMCGSLDASNLPRPVFLYRQGPAAERPSVGSWPGQHNSLHRTSGH